MNSRPKPGETEEDILKLQEEFLKNKLLPSAKYINCKNSAFSTLGYVLQNVYTLFVLL